MNRTFSVGLNFDILYDEGTKFTYTKSRKVKHDAEVIGYHVEYDSDTDRSSLQYRIQYEFCGQIMKTEVPVVTIQKALANMSGYDKTGRPIVGVVRNEK